MRRGIMVVGDQIDPLGEDDSVADDERAERSAPGEADVFGGEFNGATKQLGIVQIYFTELNRSPMAAQLTTFHHALTYSARRF